MSFLAGKNYCGYHMLGRWWNKEAQNTSTTTQDTLWKTEETQKMKMENQRPLKKKNEEFKTRKQRPLTTKKKTSKHENKDPWTRKQRPLNMKTKTQEHKDTDSPHRLTSFFYQDDIFKTYFLLLLIMISVFFKVLSRRSFFKGKWLWVSKSNMADETSYCLYFPASTARFVKKTVPIRTFLN